MRAVSAILLVIVAIGCDGGKPREAPPARARVANDEAAEVVTASNPPPLYERHAAPEPQPELDPAEVPVEEDFIEEAEQRIGKSARLELELGRLKKEIESSAR